MGRRPCGLTPWLPPSKAAEAAVSRVLCAEGESANLTDLRPLERRFMKLKDEALAGDFTRLSNGLAAGPQLGLRGGVQVVAISPQFADMS